MKKKIISLLLSLVMVITMVPTYAIPALAEDGSEGTSVSEVAEGGTEQDYDDVDPEQPTDPDEPTDPEEPSDPTDPEEPVTTEHDDVFTEENLPDEGSEFWNSHSHDDYYVGSSAFISAELPASCVKDGWKITKGENTGFCMICGKFFYHGKEVKFDANGNVEVPPEAAKTIEEGGIIVPAHGHDFENGEVVKAATCTENEIRKCANNNYEIIVTPDPETGLYSASVRKTPCEVTQEKENSSKGHDWVLKENGHKDATCTEDGYDEYVCKNDPSHTKTDVIKAIGHDWELTDHKDATCTEDGYDKYVCKNNNSHTKTDVIEKLGHDWTDWTIEQPSTCTVKGTRTRECRRCGEKDKEELELAPHQIIRDESQCVAPTCIEDGMTVGTCKICGQLVRKVEPALGHDFETVVTPPTCTDFGYTTYTCKREGCGVTYKSDYVNPTGHDWELKKHVAATCEEDGYDEYVCKNDNSHTKNVVIPKIGHKWGEYVRTVTKAPTCTDDGVYTYTRTCENDPTHTDSYTEVIPKFAHTYTKYTTEFKETPEDKEGKSAYIINEDESVERKCTEPGRNVLTCELCGDSFIEPLAPLGHLDPTTVGGQYDEVANCVHGNQYVCQRTFKDGSVCGEFVDDGKLNYNLTFNDDVDVKKTSADKNGDVYYTVDKGNKTVYRDKESDNSKSEYTIPKEAIVDGIDIYTLSKKDFYSLDDIEEIVNYGKDENGQRLTGHNYDVKEVDADCEFDQYFVFTCINEYEDKKCPQPDAETAKNEQFIVVIPNTATGHRWALRDDGSNVDPSCTKDGTRHWYCLNNHNHIYTEKIPATGHHFVLKTDESKAPTCGEDGFNLYRCDNEADDNDLDSKHGDKCDAVYKEVIPATGNHKFTVERVAATCTEDGYDKYTCSVCGYSYEVATTPAKGHDYKVTSTTPATCTEEGYDTYTCSVCGAQYNKKTTPALGHEWKVVSSTPATCTSEGYDTYKCTRCDDTYNKVTTPAKEHQFVAIAFKDATCTEEGYTTYKCINCDTTYNGDFVSKKEHTFVADVTAPTCTEEGYTTFTCSVCGAKRTTADGQIYKTNITKPVDHVFNEVSTVAPTCGKDGKKVSKCVNCGYVQEEVIPATGNHTYVEKVTKNPTCAELGEKTYTCSVCGYTYTEDIPKTDDHQYSDVVTKAADCGNVGVMTHKCDICGEEYTTEIPATGDHKYVETVTKDPTCAEKGEKTYTCSVCGYSYTEELPKTDDHKYESKITKAPTCVTPGEATLTCKECGAVAKEELPPTGIHTYAVKYVAPTCTDRGYYVYTCKVCGDTYTVQTNDPLDDATGHDYVKTVVPATAKKNGAIIEKCKNCSKTIKTTLYAAKNVSLSRYEFFYTGKDILPVVYVNDSNGKKIANTNYNVTYSNNKAIGTAKVTITFKNKYSGVVTKTFRIIPKNVGLSNITSKKRQIKFTWGRVAVCDGYQIQISTSKNFKNKTTYNIKGRSVCNKTFTKLKSGKKYYIRIRAYKTVKGKKVYGHWTTTSKTCK